MGETYSRGDAGSEPIESGVGHKGKRRPLFLGAVTRVPESSETHYDHDSSTRDLETPYLSQMGHRQEHHSLNVYN